VLARLGVEVAEDTNVAAVERDGLLTSAGRMPFDTCVWAGGFVASRLARDSGLPGDGRGQLRVDATLAVVGQPSIYAAGDAAHPKEHDGARVDMSCKTALPMGATAAANILAELRGVAPRPFGFGDTGMCISLGRRDGAIAIRRRDGSDSGRLVRGRAAAWIKEGVCRFVTGTLAVERVLPVYRWLSPERQLPAPVAS
jgi:NADH dehydrogenase